MPAMDRLLLRVKELGGSDLHLADGQPPRMRRFGQLVSIADEPMMGAGALGVLLREIAPARSLEKCERGAEGLFAYEIAGQLRARFSCYRHASGLGAVARLIPLSIPSLFELGLPAVFIDFVKWRSGLILLSGTSGSGISTTVAAFLNDINTNQARRIVTLEDPIEFIHTPARSTCVQREIGVHASSLRVALSETGAAGYDVVFAGHLHDCESIALAVNAAEHGALVLGTLRANSVSRALEQLVNTFPATQQTWIRAMLANALRAVIVQTLIPKAEGGGRCAVNEILVNTTGVASAIREGYVSKLGSMMQAGGMDGMINMDDALMRRAQAGIITPADALLKASDKTRFQSLVKTN